VKAQLLIASGERLDAILPQKIEIRATPSSAASTPSILRNSPLRRAE